MNDTDRARIRAKQDRLVELAQCQHLHADLAITDQYRDAPTLRDLQQYLYPQYEALIDRIISAWGE